MNKRYVITGHVQGVGFRPLTKRLADNMNLSGLVRNSASGVELVLNDPDSACKNFIQTLKDNLPPQAKIDKIIESDIQDYSEGAADGLFSGFKIGNSDHKGTIGVITPDIALCRQCIKDLTDPTSRYFQYPFISCSDCGPRYSITRKLPFDRPNTSMADFSMCHSCDAEYHEGDKRRFWAQTLSCKQCGPKLSLFDSERNRVNTKDPISFVVNALQEGKAIAFKNSGGDQLLVDACNSEAVARLRKVKQRNSKAFAILMKDIDMATTFTELSGASIQALESSEAPIVIAPKLDSTHKTIATNVAPDTDDWGVMLPNSPLQYLIIQQFNAPLVCTSANLSGELMVICDDLATNHLTQLADLVLTHNRHIEHRVDDSVYRQGAKSTDELIPIRLGRGRAPLSIALKQDSSSSALCFGADMKSSFSLLRENELVISQYFGDLFHADAFQAFQQEIDDWLQLYQCRPEVILCDAHPDYFSVRLAERYSEKLGVPLQKVLHHHAHIASVWAESGIPAQQPCIGIALDGLGFGQDHHDVGSTLWGMEFFKGPVNKLSRFASLKPVSIPGAEQSIKHPWRMALAYLIEAKVEPSEMIPLFTALSGNALTPESLKQQIDLLDSLPLKTSALGRLLDAVSFLLGCIEAEVDYDGQAPQKLETLASHSALSEQDNILDFTLLNKGKDTEPFIEIDFSPAIRQTINLLYPLVNTNRQEAEHIYQGHDLSDIAMMWHFTIADAINKVLIKNVDVNDIEQVFLSGGCMQNRILNLLLNKKLSLSGFTVHTHKLLPANDSAISVGQAFIHASDF